MKPMWGVLAVVAFIVLVMAVSKPIRTPKARSSRISGVNNMRSVTLTLTNTNALPTIQPGVGK